MSKKSHHSKQIGAAKGHDLMERKCPKGYDTVIREGGYIPKRKRGSEGFYRWSHSKDGSHHRHGLRHGSHGARE